MVTAPYDVPKAGITQLIQGGSRKKEGIAATSGAPLVQSHPVPTR
jgi:hypothetical protein